MAGSDAGSDAGSVYLDGTGLTPDKLDAIAGGAQVTLSVEALRHMRRTRMQLEAALASDMPMYGVTTGLGPRVVERLDHAAQQRMSLMTIRGRAHAAGAPLDPRLIRAAMAVRTNTLLLGAAGASPALAEHIAACLNAGLSPVVGEAGSIGAADLMWGGSMGLGLIGEGEMTTPHGVRPAGEALAAVGLSPYVPGPREGLAMVSHSSFVGAIAALGLHGVERVLDAAQTAAALSLEGFRANLSPLDPRVLMVRPQVGQLSIAAGLMARLDGSALTRPGAARRLQDPLSLRNVAQIHGTVAAALQGLREAVADEINAASDNPVVLADAGEVISSGGYLTPHLAVVLGTVAQALTHMAAAQVSRMAKLITPRLSDLPRGLVEAGVDSAGMAPAMKTAEALFAEIVHLAQPAPVYPSFSADGVEDVVTHSAVPAKALLVIAGHMNRLVAMELMMAAQAVELRGTEGIAPAMAGCLRDVRTHVAPVTEDRPLSGDIERLAAEVAAGTFEFPEP